MAEQSGKKRRDDGMQKICRANPNGRFNSRCWVCFKSIERFVDVLIILINANVYRHLFFLRLLGWKPGRRRRGTRQADSWLTF